MIEGLIGRKRGMTQVFDSSGDAVPVTVIEAGPCPVVGVKTEANDGYVAVCVGFDELTKKRQPRAIRERFKKLNVKPQRILREFAPLAAVELPRVGQVVDVSIFEKVKTVKVTGISKGKGFQGVVRRHHFRGGGSSHGSCFHRRPGAIGCRAFPGRIHKGKRMAGHMGLEQVTQRGLALVSIDAKRNLLFVKGAVPGPTGGIVLVRRQA